MSEPAPDRVSIVAFVDGQGIATMETLWAVPEDAGRYRLVRSPLLASGLAAGDLFEVRGDPPRAMVLERSGNVAVQVWAKAGLVMDDVSELRARVSAVGGTFDGHNTGFAAFSVPVRVGFDAMDEIFDGFVAEHPAYSWTYGNVWGDDDRPLGWWEVR